MIDRLYENMLELIRDRQEQDSNSTLCNLNIRQMYFSVTSYHIVIVHCVI